MRSCLTRDSVSFRYYAGSEYPLGQGASESLLGGQVFPQADPNVKREMRVQNLENGLLRLGVLPCVARKVQSMIRASSRSVPEPPPCPITSPETGDAFPQKAVLPEFDGVDATRLAATDCCQSLPARQTRVIRSRRTSSGRRVWLRFMRFNSRRSEGPNLKGCWHEETVLLQCTSTSAVRLFKK
jgi:hypothetical protein